MGRRTNQILFRLASHEVTAGQFVGVDWRDALPNSGEVNKRRPAIIVGSSHFFGSGLPFEIVVALTGEQALAIPGASVRIDPTRENGCTKPCYALAWNLQCVSHSRLNPTPAKVTDEQLAEIRAQISACVAR